MLLRSFLKGKEDLEGLNPYKSPAFEHLSRLIIGIILFLIVSFCIYKGGVALLLILTLISFGGIFEFCNAIKSRLGEENFLPFLILTSLYLPFYYYIPLTAYETVLIFVLFIFILSITLFKIKSGIYWVFFFSFILLYIPFLLSFAIEIRAWGWKPIFYLFFTVVIYDTFAFYIGKFFGKTKFFEKISPNKTLEGFVGGLSAVLFFNLVSFRFWEIPLISIPFFAVIIPLIAQMGDFFESYLKRSLEIKDFSNILLAHGGILDRIDSYLFALPVFYLILRIF